MTKKDALKLGFGINSMNDQVGGQAINVEMPSSHEDKSVSSKKNDKQPKAATATKPKTNAANTKTPVASTASTSHATATPQHASVTNPQHVTAATVQPAIAPHHASSTANHTAAPQTTTDATTHDATAKKAGDEQPAPAKIISVPANEVISHTSVHTSSLDLQKSLKGSMSIPLAKFGTLGVDFSNLIHQTVNDLFYVIYIGCSETKESIYDTYRLTPAAQQVLSKATDTAGRQAFVDEYGDGFINEITYGRDALMILHFRLETTSQQMDLSTKLQATAPINAKGEIDYSFQKAIAKKEFTLYRLMSGMDYQPLGIVGTEKDISDFVEKVTIDDAKSPAVPMDYNSRPYTAAIAQLVYDEEQRYEQEKKADPQQAKGASTKTTKDQTKVDDTKTAKKTDTPDPAIQDTEKSNAHDKKLADIKILDDNIKGIEASLKMARQLHHYVFEAEGAVDTYLQRLFATQKWKKPDHFFLNLIDDRAKAINHFSAIKETLKIYRDKIENDTCDPVKLRSYYPSLQFLIQEIRRAFMYTPEIFELPVRHIPSQDVRNITHRRGQYEFNIDVPANATELSFDIKGIEEQEDIKNFALKEIITECLKLFANIVKDENKSDKTKLNIFSFQIKLLLENIGNLNHEISSFNQLRPRFIRGEKAKAVTPIASAQSLTEEAYKEVEEIRLWAQKQIGDVGNNNLPLSASLEAIKNKIIINQQNNNNNILLKWKRNQYSDSSSLLNCFTTTTQRTTDVLADPIKDGDSIPVGDRTTNSYLKYSMGDSYVTRACNKILHAFNMFNPVPPAFNVTISARCQVDNTPVPLPDETTLNENSLSRITSIRGNKK